MSSLKKLPTDNFLKKHDETFTGILNYMIYLLKLFLETNDGLQIPMLYFPFE